MPFGKSVRLVVSGANGAVFSSGNLRVDFDIRVVSDFSRARFDIYNLNTKTIREISNEERYLDIYITQHGIEQQLTHKYYISNAVTEKKVPDSITSLFCVSSAKKDFTEKEISMVISKPSLKKTLDQISRGSGHIFKYEGFPPGLEDRIPLSPTAMISGKIETVVRDLGKMYGFTAHPEGKIIYLIFQPTESNIHLTNYGTRPHILLNTDNMRANPKIGIAQIEVNSNLDPRMRAGVLLDTSKLITAGASDNFNTLTVARNIIRDQVAGRSVFSILSVNHKGSSHTKEWNSIAIATKTTIGKNTNSYNWQQ